MAVTSCASADGSSDTGETSDTSEPVDGQTSVVRAPLVEAQPSLPTEDFVVKLRGASKAGLRECTGVMLSPTILLTARHCVTEGDLAATNSQCELGSDVLQVSSVVALVGRDAAALRPYPVRRIVIDRDTDVCTSDYAGIELAEPITGITFPPVEIDNAPRVGDAVTGVGWGKISDAENGNPTVRQRSTGVVLGISGGSYPNRDGLLVNIEDGFIVSSVQTCFGDSGSPLLDSRGAVIGVLVGGRNVSSTADTCVGSVSHYVQLYKFGSFVERLFQADGAMPNRAGKPAPASLGGACQQNNECNSNYCVGVGQHSLCSKTCTVDTDCGGALVCTPTGGAASVCLDTTSPPARDESCSVVGGSAGGRPAGASGKSGHWPVGVMVAASFAMLLAARRRRSRPTT